MAKVKQDEGWLEQGIEGIVLFPLKLIRENEAVRTIHHSLLNG